MSRKVFMRHNNDCMTACLATVLGLPYEAVPRFIKDDNTEVEGGFIAAVDSWVLTQGYQLISVNANADFIRRIKGLVIVWGESYTPGMKELGFIHAVVYKDGELWHDPKPDPAGVIEPQGFDVLVQIFEE